MNIMIRVILSGIILVCTVTYFTNGQSILKNTAEKLRSEIEAINNTTGQLYVTENSDALIDLYSDELTFFPEYKPAIFEIPKLKRFLNDWFGQGNIKTYKKKIYSVEAFSDHLLEIGSLHLDYSSVHTPQGEYDGKYMILWKRNKKGKLKIISETFGAEKYIEPEQVPYAGVQVANSNFVAKHKVSNELQKMVEEFNAIVLKAVAEGDGNARANGFTNDAILLSNFDSMRVGMKEIRPKMLKTYTPGMSYIVQHTYNRIFDLGNFVFISGHYKGGWGDSTNGGRFEGNMANLMKRTENGTLLMHRQAGNRESKLILFKN